MSTDRAAAAVKVLVIVESRILAAQSGVSPLGLFAFVLGCSILLPYGVLLRTAFVKNWSAPLAGNFSLEHWVFVFFEFSQTKLALYTSYVVAGRVASGRVPDALFWDTADPYDYLRIEPEGDQLEVATQLLGVRHQRLPELGLLHLVEVRQEVVH